MLQQGNYSATNTKLMTDDYDSPWKEAVEHCLIDFMAFYFPEAYTQIDWTKEHVFLDQELRAIVQNAELGKRFVDKLVRLTLLDGDEKWIYIHIEVQGSKQAEFAKRIFVYNYRIFDRYDKPVASLAVLADEQADWRPDNFCYSALGCETSIRFPVAKLTDFHNRLDELLAAENTFAIVTATHILTQRTRKNYYDRYEAKRMLVRLLYQRQWEKHRVIDLFRVIDWMMKLPEELEQQLWQEIVTIEENAKMQYVTSIERIGMARGLARGLAKGREEGREEGLIEGEKKTLRRQLERRFTTVPDWAVERIANASDIELGLWLDNVLDAASIELVFAEQASSH